MGDPTTSYTRDNDLVTREIAGEAIIVPIRSQVGDLGGIFALNEVGTLVWQLIDGRKTMRQIVDDIMGQYDIGSEEAEKDVMEFLQSLEDAGLVRRVCEEV